MARTSGSKGFFFKKSLSPNVENPMRIEVLLTNSTGPLTIGDAVQFTSGYLTIAAQTELVLGILEGFVDKDGRNIFQSGVSVSGTKSGDDTYTAASDNATVDMVKGVVNCDPNALFYNVADDTLTQAMVGTCFDTNTTSDEIDVATSAAPAAAAGTFQLIELVTVDDSGATQTKAGLFKIKESQLTTNDIA
jgi:hypothetical protein